MYSAVTVKNFRCFERFSIEPLARVNLIAGKNSVGKTALLEAIYLLIGAQNIELAFRIGVFRGFELPKVTPTILHDLFWSPLFLNLNLQTVAEVAGRLTHGGSQQVRLSLVPRTSARVPAGEKPIPETIDLDTQGQLNKALKLSYVDPKGDVHDVQMMMDGAGIRVEPAPSEPPFPGAFMTAHHKATTLEDVERFGRLELGKTSYDLLKVLQLVEPRLRRVVTISTSGIPALYGDVGIDRLLPLPLMGDGLGRLASILLAIASCSHGVLLVDEVETGFHHSVMGKVWEAIGEAAHMFDAQVFTTTHSFECIREAHNALTRNGSGAFRLHRLERTGRGIEAITYDEESLSAAIKNDLEIR